MLGFFLIAGFVAALCGAIAIRLESQARKAAEPVTRSWGTDGGISREMLGPNRRRKAARAGDGGAFPSRFRGAA